MMIVEERSWRAGEQDDFGESGLALDVDLLLEYHVSDAGAQRAGECNVSRELLYKRAQLLSMDG